MIKRILCLLLCLSFFASGMVYAETNEANDEQRELQKAYFNELGINTEFMDQPEVSRGLCLTAILQLIGADIQPIDEHKLFDDVDENTEYCDEIYTGASMGIVSGNGGSFRPQDYTTMLEAQVMIMNVLGYRHIVDTNGGFPNGYISLGNGTKLLSGVNGSYNAAVSGAQLAKMLYNALTCEVIEFYKDGSKEGYKTVNGHDLLWTYRNVTKAEGIATAANGAALTDPTRFVKDNIIEINGVSYTYEGQNTDVLGKHIIGYVSRDDMDRLEYVIPYKNTVLTASADQFDRVENGRLYKENGKQFYKLDDSYKFIYNGKACTSFTPEQLIPDSGYITLIDNNNDDRYEVISVESYSFMTITTVNQFDNIFYGENENGDAQVTFMGNDIHSAFEADTDSGIAAIKYYEIQNGDTIAYAVSEDQSRVKVIRLDRAVSGTAKNIQNGDEKCITIGDAEYKTTKYFDKKFAQMLGKDGKFVLSPDGKLVLFKNQNEDGYNYGYLMNVYEDPNEDSVMIRIYTIEDREQVFKAVSRMRIDGVSTENENIKSTLTGENGLAQLVRYRLDGSGILTDIDTAEKAVSLENSKNINNSLLCFNDHIRSRMKTGSMAFRNFFLSDGAIIFAVNETASGTLTKDDVMIADRNYFTNDSEYTVSTYDMFENGYYKVLVVYGDVGDKMVSDRSGVGVVEKLTEAINPNEPGEMGYLINLWTSGSFVSYFIGDDVDIINPITNKKVAVGDIIRFEVKSGEITNIGIDFDGESMQFTDSGSSYVKGDNGFSSLLDYSLFSLYKKYGSYCFVSSVKNADGSYNYSLENLRGLDLSSVQCVAVINNKFVKSVNLSDVSDYVSSNRADIQIVTGSRYWGYNMAVIYAEGEL